jgi:hypothetical protein
MEKEYVRLQNFFFKTLPLIVESNETVNTDSIYEKAVKEEKPIMCNVCGGKYTHFNKGRHELTKKHLNAV